MGPWVLAIDFGTSSSCAAVWVDGRPSELQIGGEVRIPSTVVLDESGSIVAGRIADNQAALHPDRAERTPKQLLGTPAPLLLGGQAIGVEVAAGAVLRVLYDEAVAQQGAPPARVVLTHPARWSDGRMGALRSAAGYAGITDPLLCPEPVAAAVHYASERSAPGALVAIYDLGGGTFDTAVLRRSADGFDVVGDTGGIEDLGGEQFDGALFAHLGEELAAIDAELWEQISESDELRWKRAAAELLARARDAKEALSKYPTTRVAVPDSNEALVVTRAELEALVQPDLEASVTELERTVTAAGLSVADLEAVHLTGGSSRIPLVERLLTGRFGPRVTTYADPKLIVALGAAAWGASQLGRRASAPAPAPAPPAPAPPAPDLTAPDQTVQRASLPTSPPPTAPPPALDATMPRAAMPTSAPPAVPPPALDKTLPRSALPSMPQPTPATPVWNPPQAPAAAAPPAPQPSWNAPTTVPPAIPPTPPTVSKSRTPLLIGIAVVVVVALAAGAFVLTRPKGSDDPPAPPLSAATFEVERLDVTDSPGDGSNLIFNIGTMEDSTLFSVGCSFDGDVCSVPRIWRLDADSSWTMNDADDMGSGSVNGMAALPDGTLVAVGESFEIEGEGDEAFAGPSEPALWISGDGGDSWETGSAADFGEPEEEGDIRRLLAVAEVDDVLAALMVTLRYEDETSDTPEVFVTVFTSADGESWTEGDDSTFNGISYLASITEDFEGELVVATSTDTDDGGSEVELFSTADGVTWEKVSAKGIDSGTTVSSGAYVNGQLYLLGQTPEGGSRLWSTDDIDGRWTEVEQFDDITLEALVEVPGGLLAVGSEGTDDERTGVVYISDDTETWEEADVDGIEAGFWFGGGAAAPGGAVLIGGTASEHEDFVVRDSWTLSIDE